jgi:hypothetical protein
MLKYLITGAISMAVAEGITRATKRVHALNLKQRLKARREEYRYRRLANRYHKAVTRNTLATLKADKAEAQLLDYMIAHNVLNEE